MRFFVTVGLMMVMALGCSPHLGERPALPTAIAGLSSNDTVFETPAPMNFKTPTPSGPTSTPAPWATALPPTPLPPAPEMGHQLAGNENCAQCHTMNSFYNLPADHAKRAPGTCLGCHHQPESLPPPAITHPVAGYEACLMCHLQGKNGAPVEPGDHAGRLNDTCLNCHKPK